MQVLPVIYTFLVSKPKKSVHTVNFGQNQIVLLKKTSTLKYSAPELRSTYLSKPLSVS